jgi:hypothetical protein
MRTFCRKKGGNIEGVATQEWLTNNCKIAIAKSGMAKSRVANKK